MKYLTQTTTMHELSVCQSMLAQIQQIADEHAAHSVSRVHIQIGPLSGVEAELLAQAFPIACAGSLAQDATLSIDALPIKVRCQACGAESEAEQNRLLCKKCGDWHTTLISGDELLLTRIELNK